MSQENVEIVREGFARWNDGDYDFFFDSAAPDVELHSRFGSLTGEPYRGHEGMREWLADIEQSFDRFDLWLDDVRDLGDDVLAIGGINMRARESGLDMKQPMGRVLEFGAGAWRECGSMRNLLRPSKQWGCRSRRAGRGMLGWRCRSTTGGTAAMDRDR